MAEIGKTIVTNFFFVDFWEFCFFSHFHTYLDLKSIRCSTSCSCKHGSQFDRKKELQAMRDEKEWFFVCYILDIYYSFNSIIHCIAWTHSKYMKWWSRPFNKGEILAPNRLNILSSYIEYKRVALKKIIIKVTWC